MTQCLAGLVVLACMWVLFGYSLTFGPDHGGLIGDFSSAFFMGLDDSGCVESSGVTFRIPSSTLAIFQQNFACVTPLLITGTVAERMRFKPYLVFIIVWETIVYYPLAHWIWGGGWLGQLGTQDFAGGIVIHTSSGISALILAIELGKRAGWDRYHGVFPHSDLRYAAVGASLLWVGWFGFNAGSALGANKFAIQAIINTQIGACFSATVWLICGWLEEKPSVLDVMNGAVAGMAGITPASGYIASQSAIVVSILLGLGAYYGAKLLHRAEIDDALEVSCIHGLTGVIGAISIGFAGSSNINPTSRDGIIYGDSYLLGVQVLGVFIALVYPGIVTFVMLKIMNKFMRLRARPDHEEQGLDYWHHRLDVIHEEEEVAELLNRDRQRKKADPHHLSDHLPGEGISDRNINFTPVDDLESARNTPSRFTGAHPKTIVDGNRSPKPTIAANSLTEQLLPSNPEVEERPSHSVRRLSMRTHHVLPHYGSSDIGSAPSVDSYGGGPLHIQNDSGSDSSFPP